MRELMYERLVLVGRKLQSPLLFVIRLYWGIFFLFAGWGKLQNISQVTQFFASMSIPAPNLNAILVSIIEFVGGILLILGLASRPAALLLTIVMSVALYLTNHGQGLWYEPQSFATLTPFSFMFAALIVFIFGPGSWSIDYIWGKERFESRK